MANDNALHWQQALRVQQANNKTLRADLRLAHALLQDLLDTGAISCGDRRKKARELLDKE